MNWMPGNITITVQFNDDRGQPIGTRDYSANSRIFRASRRLRDDVRGHPFGERRQERVEVACDPNLFHIMCMLLDGQPLWGEVSRGDFENLFRLADLIITDEGTKAEFYRRLASVRTSGRDFRDEARARPRRLPRQDDTEYNVSGDRLGKEDISSIGRMKQLQRLVMRGCVIEPDSFGDRLDGLERLGSLVELDLSGTHLGHKDAHTIGRIRNLEVLIMQGCDITPDSFGDRLDGLERLHNLKQLNIYGVKLGEKDRSVLHKLSSKGAEVWC